MIVEFQAFRLFLGAARLVAITPEPGMFYLRQERLQVAVRMVWHRALVPVLEFCAYHCRGDRDLFARYGECGSLHSAQARRSCLSDLAWLQDMETRPRSSTRSEWSESVSEGYFGKTLLSKR